MSNRRRWTVEDKQRAIKEASAPGMTVSFVARQYGIAPSLLFRWRRAMLNGDKNPLNRHEMSSLAEVQELKRQVHALERLVGKKTLESELLKEALTTLKSEKATWGSMIRDSC